MRGFIQLIKPGIIAGNLITAAAGFFLARGSAGLFPMLLGLGLIIAGASVCNNYIDREIDQKMDRTKTRPKISFEKAFILAMAFGGNGFFILSAFTNSLTFFIALLGFGIYVLAYSFMKHKTDLATLVGSIAGATPPLVGYCAVANTLDYNAFLIFMAVALWQMPHFYAIALYRMKEYAAAGVPVLPVTRGIENTKIQSMVYTVGFAAVANLLNPWTLIPSLGWVALSLSGFKAKEDRRWARWMFIYSLVVICLFSIALCTF